MKYIHTPVSNLGGFGECWVLFTGVQYFIKQTCVVLWEVDWKTEFEKVAAAFSLSVHQEIKTWIQKIIQEWEKEFKSIINKIEFAFLVVKLLVHAVLQFDVNTLFFINYIKCHMQPWLWSFIVI